MSRWRAEGIFRAMKILCDPIVRDTWDYILVQTHRVYSTKSDPNIHSGLWVMMMGLWGFIGPNECPCLVGVLLMETVHVLGRGEMGTLCTFLFILL